MVKPELLTEVPGLRCPKIGIRPVIDGRRLGVRESLEKQTMQMAGSVAKLLTEELKYPNGQPVECIVAATTIGGAAEAARVAEDFAKENVGLSITVTPCWCYGAETIDLDPIIPKAVWGFNGTERPGAVYLAAALAAHDQKGRPAFAIYGQDVQDKDDCKIPPDVSLKLLRFAKAGLAAAQIKGKTYLAMGGVSMGIAGSIIDPHFLEAYLGMRYDMVDMSEFTRRLELEIYDPREYQRARQWVKKHCLEGPDPNPENIKASRTKKDSDWDTVVKMTIIARDLMIGNPNLESLGFGEEALGHNAILSGFQGQRQWTDFMPNGDFMETILNSSFDWNGTRQPYLMATENDALNGVAMLFNHLLTNTAQIFADIRTYWSPPALKRVTGKELTGPAANGIIHLINSGSVCLDGSGQQMLNGKPAIKPFWEINSEEVLKCLEAARFCYANLGYFRGGGFSTELLTRGGMPVTMVRVNLVKGLGPVLQIAEGYTIDLEQDVSEKLIKRTDPTWPTTWFVPVITGHGAFKDVYSVMNNWGANHGAISYGHIGADLITLASILRIPVAMHNVAEAEVFRPKAWSAFGTADLEGADFRACSAYGPLYG